MRVRAIARLILDGNRRVGIVTVLDHDGVAVVAKDIELWGHPFRSLNVGKVTVRVPSTKIHKIVGRYSKMLLLDLRLPGSQTKTDSGDVELLRFAPS